MPLDKLPSNTPTPPQASMVPPQAPTPTHASAPVKKPHQPVGPLIGIFIIMGLLMVGALYFWGQQLNKQPVEPTYIPGDTV